MKIVSKTFDSICAISSPPGIGGVSLIRISGKDAIIIVDTIFSKSLQNLKGYQIIYGKILDKNEIIDDVLLSIFKNPHSYTGENTVEINCHGSTFIQQKIIELLINKGARLALPGEFSKRAFLNGKLDLSQTEDFIFTSSSSFSLRDESIKLAPKEANFIANAFPIPEVAPVIQTVFPLNSIIL